MLIFPGIKGDKTVKNLARTIPSFLLGLIVGGGLGLYLGFRSSKLLYIDICPRCGDYLAVVGDPNEGFSMKEMEEIKGIKSDDAWFMVERAREARAGGERIKGWILEWWPGLKRSYVGRMG